MAGGGGGRGAGGGVGRRPMRGGDGGQLERPQLGRGRRPRRVVAGVPCGGAGNPAPVGIGNGMFRVSWVSPVGIGGGMFRIPALPVEVPNQPNPGDRSGWVGDDPCNRSGFTV
eukprot:gene13249-biopygen13371